MKKSFTIFSFFLLTASIYAQSPQKLSYQAIVRDNNNALVTNTQIGLEINIRQGSPTGPVVYSQIQTPYTNTNGLVSIEIGGNTGFSTIDWASGPYYLETNTAIMPPLTTYTITGTSQILSVPYALHAKTAENITGSLNEIDPIFVASPAGGITSVDISNWNTAYSWGNHASAGYLTSYTETDPLWSASPSFGITATHINNWNTAYSWGNHANAGYLTSYTENDPVFSASVAIGITVTDTSNWNNKQNQLIAGGGISINGNIISTKTNFYLGQDTLGGIVFYLYMDKYGEQHGLIVSKTETTAKWSYSVDLVYANRSDDGYYNTDLMIESPAKAWAKNIGSEWYLPSIDELNLLWIHRFHVNKTARAINSTLLSTAGEYWSSLENNATQAITFDFGLGYTSVHHKNSNYKIRAIRSF